MSQVDQVVSSAVRRMRNNAAGRDSEMSMISEVRGGNMSSVWRDRFPDDQPFAMIANYVDVFARDMAENLAALPGLKCSAGQNRTSADKRRAELKNRVGQNFWRNSQLEQQMLWGADQYVTYGFLPFRLEADYDGKQPVIHVDDPMGTYYELDRWMSTVRYAKTWRQTVGELAAMYEDRADIVAALMRGQNGMQCSADSEVEVIYYIDGKQWILYVPERQGLVLSSVQHNFGFCPVRIAVRPGLQRKPRGQFTDVVYIQLARAMYANLALEAATTSVQAPIVVPTDMQTLPVGPNAVYATDNPDGIKRVNLELSPTAFQMSQELDTELKLGARYPETRTGNTSASVITGRGIEALNGTFDGQIAASQRIIGLALREITQMAFKMDLALWPKKNQTINGTISGETFQVTYCPSRDFADDFIVDVSYGMMTGMAVQNVEVALLQLRGDSLIDRDTVRRALPFDLNADTIQQNIDIEETADAAKQGLYAGLQAVGQMMAGGQGEQAMNLINAALQLAKDRASGKTVIESLEATFGKQQQAAQEAQEQAQQAQAQAAQQQAPGDPGAGGDPSSGYEGATTPGVQDSGLLQGQAAGQAGQGVGGTPSVQRLLAGISGSGQANLTASVRRSTPTG